MRAFQHAAKAASRTLSTSTHASALFSLLLTLSTSAPAAVYRCIDADGTSTFSDRACEPKRSNEPKPSDSPPGATGTAGANGASGALGAEPAASHHPDGLREKKAAHILDVLRIAPSEPEMMLLRRTVDDAAPDLVKALDPDNGNWTPANYRWHMVSEFVKTDLRRDVQPALRASTLQVAQIAAREYAARANDADMDAVTAFLNTPEGSRYIAFQNEIRPLLYAARSAVEAQEPPPETTPTEQEFRHRRQLLSLTLEYRIAKENGTSAPASIGLLPGSTTVVENTVRREGTALDALYNEYEYSLPAFQAFTDAATSKHFFVAVEPALRTQLALSSTATTDFAESEYEMYFTRWRAYYGPGVWVRTRNTVLIRGRTVYVSNMTTTHFANTPGSQQPELMAIQCEQREENMYQMAHRFASDYPSRTAAYKDIQNRCRAEQHLPPLH